MHRGRGSNAVLWTGASVFCFQSTFRSIPRPQHKEEQIALRSKKRARACDEGRSSSRAPNRGHYGADVKPCGHRAARVLKSDGRPAGSGFSRGRVYPVKRNAGEHCWIGYRYPLIFVTEYQAMVDLALRRCSDEQVPAGVVSTIA